MMASTRGTSRTRTAFVGAAIVLVAVVLLTAFLGGYLGSSSNHTTISSTQGGSTSSTGSTSLSQSSSITTTTTTTSTNSVSYANDWLTYHKDNNRSGYDAFLSNVNSPSLSWKTKVDGAVYAEPLFFNGVVYAATENNTVYAISATNGTVEWSSNLGPPVNVTVAPYICSGNTPDILPTVGITGTPAIDPTTDTIYVAPFISGSGYHMVALDTITGQVRWSIPIAPSGFNTVWEEERGALAIANGMVYVPFGGFSYVCGPQPPSGWLMAFALKDNGTQYVYEVPAPIEADIWTPEGVSVDSSGFVYVVTGDSSSAGQPPANLGDSVIKLSPRLSLVDYFAPPNYAFLNSNDTDLGSTGATLLPGNLIFSMGKDGVGYLLNSSHLGGISGQLFDAGVCTKPNATGAWGSTSFAQGIIYVPCSYGLFALKVQMGANANFTSLWNYPGFWATPPIIAAGAVWTFDVYSGTLYALNPGSGALMYEKSFFSQTNLLAHFTTPSVGGGLLLFGGNDTIYALNPTT